MIHHARTPPFLHLIMDIYSNSGYWKLEFLNVFINHIFDYYLDL